MSDCEECERLERGLRQTQDAITYELKSFFKSYPAANYNLVQEFERSIGEKRRSCAGQKSALTRHKNDRHGGR